MHFRLLFRFDSYDSVSATCAGKLDDVRCAFGGLTDIPVTLLRYFIYQSWALNYPEATEIMLADYRDVFFQSNPFKYKVNDKEIIIRKYLKILFDDCLGRISWMNIISFCLMCM